MSVINYRSIIDVNSGMIEYRFRVPIESLATPVELSDAEETLALAKMKGDESIWINAGLLSAQLKRIERSEREDHEQA